MKQDYTQLTDNEICALSKTDTLACEFLLRKYSPLVKKIARSFFLIGAETDDLVQEGMLGLYKAINTFNKDKSSFTTYCTMCIKNAILDAIKSANTKKNMPLNTSVSIHQPTGDEDSNFLIDLLTTDFDSVEILSMKEDYASLVKFINESFSSVELKVLKLYLDGLTYAEIADNLGVDYKKVDNSIQKIKKKLQNNHKNK